MGYNMTMERIPKNALVLRVKFCDNQNPQMHWSRGIMLEVTNSDFESTYHKQVVIATAIGKLLHSMAEGETPEQATVWLDQTMQLATQVMNGLTKDSEDDYM